MDEDEQLMWVWIFNKLYYAGGVVFVVYGVEHKIKR